jgi:hypothetical protein
LFFFYPIIITGRDNTGGSNYQHNNGNVNQHSSQHHNASSHGFSSGNPPARYINIDLSNKSNSNYNKLDIGEPSCSIMIKGLPSHTVDATVFRISYFFSYFSNLISLLLQLQTVLAPYYPKNIHLIKRVCEPYH